MYMLYISVVYISYIYQLYISVNMDIYQLSSSIIHYNLKVHSKFSAVFGNPDLANGFFPILLHPVSQIIMVTKGIIILSPYSFRS